MATKNKRPAIPDIQADFAAHAEANRRELAGLAQPMVQGIVLSGLRTARAIGPIEHQLESIRTHCRMGVIACGAGIETLEMAGALPLHRLMMHLRKGDVAAEHP
jgi:hypothetical protein